MTPFFTADSVRVAYESRFHFSWYAQGRQPMLLGLRSILERSFHEVANRQNYHVLGFDLEPSVLRALLSLRPETSPSEVTRFVKGNLAAIARTQEHVANLWSRGWFVRSVGHVTNDTVREYVASQYDHHDALPGGDLAGVAKACYQSNADPCKLRVSNHGEFEYNLHVVFVTSRRREVLDLEVAEALVEYLKKVCDTKGWIAWNIEVVWNHVHFFLGLSPSDAPGEVALSLINNAEYFLQQRYAAMLKDEIEHTVWQPGYYVGTVGSATTAQVKSFLGRR